MTARILRIELRRSMALWAAAYIALLGAAAFYSQGNLGVWWGRLALLQRAILGLLLPIALAAGAWQARRERRCRMDELIATTPRARWRRVLPTAIAMAIAAVAGYLVMFAAGAATVGLVAGYFPIGSLLVVAVGALAMVPAVLLGLAVGAYLPSALTAPVLGVAGVAALAVAPRIVFSTTYLGDPPGVLLLVPTLQVTNGVTTEFVTVTGRTHLSQALWLAALATTALLLFLGASRRARVAAILPVIVGVAVALPLMPRDYAAAYTVDPGATALVCTADLPRVCVTRVHTAALTDLSAPAREALTILSAKLPHPPTSVVEDSANPTRPYPTPQRADTVLVWLPVKYADGRPQSPPEELLRDMLAGAGTAYCPNMNAATAAEHDRYVSARFAAAAWLIGQPTVLPRGVHDPQAVQTLTARALQYLQNLPVAEQQTRVVALREAALTCDGRDLMDVLTGPDGPR